MRHLFKKLAAGITAACMFAAMAVPLETSAAIVYGDVNNDGVVSMTDLTNLNKYLAGQLEITDYVPADVNQNCVVDAVDANILLRFLTLSISSLPYTTDGGGSSYATVGATPVNSLMGYTVFDATDAMAVDSYYLDSNPVVDNSRGIVGTDTRYGDDSLSGVVKILTRNLATGINSWGTGFVVDEHTIATAAHCVFNKDCGTFEHSKTEIQKILVLNNAGNIAQVITGAYDVHIPNGYITYCQDTSDQRYRGYDYAMITVSESLTPYANFNLGVMTDGMMSDSELLYCTGFPHEVEDGNPDTDDTVNNNTTPQNVYSATNKHNKFTGVGTLIHDNSSNVINRGLPIERTFYHNIDSGTGNSGGPVYTVTTVETTKYYTVVGILTGGGSDTEDNSGYNFATQMTTELLHFYKNNPNIYWE